MMSSSTETSFIHLLPLPLLFLSFLSLPLPVSSEPIQITPPSLSNCLPSSSSSSIAPSDQLLDLTTFYSSFDTGQTSLGKQGKGIPISQLPPSVSINDLDLGSSKSGVKNVVRRHDLQGNFNGFESINGISGSWSLNDSASTLSDEVISKKFDLLRLIGIGNVGRESIGYSNSTNFLSTLLVDSSVLNFQTFQNQSALCESIRIPGFQANGSSNGLQAGDSNNPNSTSLTSDTSGCPYGPGDIAMGIVIPLSNSYPLTTITTRITVLDTSVPPLTLACYDLSVTPYFPNGWYYRLMRWFPIGLIILWSIAMIVSRIYASVTQIVNERETFLASSLSFPPHPHPATITNNASSNPTTTNQRRSITLPEDRAFSRTSGTTHVRGGSFGGATTEGVIPPGTIRNSTTKPHHHRHSRHHHPKHPHRLTGISRLFPRRFQQTTLNNNNGSTNATVNDFPGGSGAIPIDPIDGKTPSTFGMIFTGPVWWRSWSGIGFKDSGSLLRFDTPGLVEIWKTVAWTALLAGVAVRWPGFAYPIFATQAWSLLLFNVTLTQSDSSELHSPLYTPPFDPPSNFNTQLSDPTSPIFISPDTPNVLSTINSRNSSSGLSSLALAVGLRPQDLFPICTAFFLMLVGAAVVLAFAGSILEGWRDWRDGNFKFGFGTGRKIRGNEGGRRNERNGKGGFGMGVGGNSINKGSPPTPNSKAHEAFGDERMGGVNYRGRDGGGGGDGDSGDGYISERDGNELEELRNSRGGMMFGDEDTSNFSHDTREFSIRDEYYEGLHWRLLLGNVVRLLMLFHLPLTTFSIYQIYLHTRSECSTISFILAVLVLIFICFAFPILLIVGVFRISYVRLWEHLPTLLALGPLYNVFTDDCRLFYVVTFVENWVVGAILGGLQQQATAQAVVILVTEIIDTLITSLWLPWGEDAVMGPLAFVLSVVRIIIAVLLVILSPVVGMSHTAAGWIAYVVLILQALIYVLLLIVLFIKLLELGIRLIGPVPFDESGRRSAGGLGGAMRKWDRNGKKYRSSRHRRRRRGGRGPGGSEGSRTTYERPSSRLQSNDALTPPSRLHYGRQGGDVSGSINTGTHLLPHKRSSSFGSYGGDPVTYGHVVAAKRPETGGPQPFPASGDDNEEGFIMSAMSSGPWARPVSGHFNDFANPGYVAPGSYAAANPPLTWGNEHPNTSQQSTSGGSGSGGFTRVGGFKATQNSPFPSRASQGRSGPSQSSRDSSVVRPRATSQSAQVEIYNPMVGSSTSLSQSDGGGGSASRPVTSMSTNRPPSRPMLPATSDLLSNTAGRSNGSTPRPGGGPAKGGRVPTTPTDVGGGRKNKGFFGRFASKNRNQNALETTDDTDDWSDDDDEEEWDSPSSPDSPPVRRGRLFGGLFGGDGGGGKSNGRKDRPERKRRSSTVEASTVEDGDGEEESDGGSPVAQSSGKAFEVVRRPRPTPNRPPQQGSQGKKVEEGETSGPDGSGGREGNGEREDS